MNLNQTEKLLDGSVVELHVVDVELLMMDVEVEWPV